MCGITGKVSWDGCPVDISLVKRMMDMLTHRGPDDEGMYVNRQVVLGHRRLSIIDLKTGKQPICNEDRTVWIVFNGEIYNFKELREELVLAGHRFATQTDTEVIVHLYEEYEEDCVSKLRGMFAFAIWDERKKKLMLARDRVGIKPLYYSVSGKSMLFASEMKAIIVDPSVERKVDPEIIDRFLTFHYVPGSDTLIPSIQKLQPGHYLILQDGKVRIREYWDLKFETETRDRHIDQTVGELIELLRETVRGHMISDVPVGVLLSGGVDSTGILSFCIEETDKNVKTFTIGFDGEKFADERTYARLVAQRYGTEHYEMSISPQMFRDFLPKYVWYMEEPVCEPPAIALYYVTRLAREHVKVLLSGEGGDEAFAGYQNYRNLVWLERFKALGKPWASLARVLLSGLGRSDFFSRFVKYIPLMHVPLIDYYYSRTSGPFVSFNQIREQLYTPEFRAQVSRDRSLQYLRECFEEVADQPTLNQMLYADTKTWLPDDLLIKADRMTMANSVELRVPLLDHKVLEFAASLPLDHKLKGITTKRILKKALHGRIPRQVLERKKAGFPIPLQSWFRGELKDFSRDVLLDRNTLARNYFKKDAIEGLFNGAQREAKHDEIFSLVILELWHRQFLTERPYSTV
jgi:asparagine synthase (glutamine-hydrolysing)